RDAEADADWQIGHASKLAHVRTQLRVQIRARAGHSRHRYIIEKATGGARDRATPVQRRRRREQVDDVETVGARGPLELTGFLGRQIDRKYPVDTRPRGVRAQPLASVVKDRVEVPEQDNRNLRLG